MKNFIVKIQVDAKFDIEATDTDAAAELARLILSHYPLGEAKILSVYAEDYVPPEKQGRRL